MVKFKRLTKGLIDTSNKSGSSLPPAIDCTMCTDWLHLKLSPIRHKLFLIRTAQKTDKWTWDYSRLIYDPDWTGLKCLSWSYRATLILIFTRLSSTNTTYFNKIYYFIQILVQQQSRVPDTIIGEIMKLLMLLVRIMSIPMHNLIALDLILRTIYVF